MTKRLKSLIALLLVFILTFSMVACSKEKEQEAKEDSQSVTQTESDSSEVAQDQEETSTQEIETSQRVEELLSSLTLEEKVGQMIQPAVYNVSTSDMEEYGYGSILSYTSYMDQSELGWKNTVLTWQKAALNSSSGIPYLFGNDAVHGVNVSTDSVIFPHNIGIGAANNPELTYKMGEAVANELKLTGMIWNFSPCLAVASEPRWGRTYESYSSDPEIVKTLGEAYSKGQLDNGIIVTAKHFIGDGSIGYGTGEDDFLIDRGDATLNDEQLEALLDIYRTQIAAGVQTIMISHSSLNGTKMRVY